MLVTYYDSSQSEHFDWLGFENLSILEHKRKENSNFESRRVSLSGNINISNISWEHKYQLSVEVLEISVISVICD